MIAWGGVRGWKRLVENVRIPRHRQIVFKERPPPCSHHVADTDHQHSTVVIVSRCRPPASSTCRACVPPPRPSGPGTRPPSVFRVTNNKRRRRCGINVSSPSSSSSSSSEAACDVLLITVTCWGCHHLSRIVTSLVHYIRKLFIVASVKVTSRTTMATQV